MEAIAAATEKFKEFAKSSQDFAYDVVVHWRDKSNRRNPIEILKRLQREAFSDIMKLRDRQDKVERMLTFYKTLPGSPFREASTHVRGEIDVVGGFLVMDGVDQQHRDAVERAGIRTGINSRLIFETTVWQKDTLVAEFTANEYGESNNIGSPLSLAKVLYAASVSDWFSAVAIPLGARCRDVGVGTSDHYQNKGLTDYSGFGPPLLNQLNGSAFGVMVRKSNVIFSLAEFVSALGLPNSAGLMCCFSTFGQVVYQLTSNSKLSLLGVHKVPRLSTQRVSLGAMAVPVGVSRWHESSDSSLEENGSQSGMHQGENTSAGSVALMLESKLDESTKIGGWIEMQKSNPEKLQWALTMSDIPDDDFGWGLSFGGSVQSLRNWDHLQAEAFLNFNFGKRFRLQPSLMYVTDGATKFPALMFRSSWSL